MEDKLAQRIGLLVVLSAVTWLALPRLQKDVEFYDEGVYLAAGRAMASGNGYVDPRLPASPPQIKYPPFLPGVLSLLWRLAPRFPENLLPMRMAMLGCGLLFLCVSCFYLVSGMGFHYSEALAITAMLGASSVFLNYTTTLSTEIPYALISIGALYWHGRHLATGKLSDLCFALGFAALGFLTRIIGIALFGVIVLGVWIQRRRLVLVALISGLAVFLFWQAWSWNGQNAYRNYPTAIALNYQSYLAELSLLHWNTRLPWIISKNFWTMVYNWGCLAFPWAARFMSGLVIACLYVLVRYGRRRLSPVDLYCSISAGFILLWPWPFNDRFVLVMGPFLIAYVFSGIKLFFSLKSASTHQTGQRNYYWVIGLLVAGSLAHSIVDRRDYQQARQAIANQRVAFHRMLDWVRINTAANTCLIGNFDPLYYLYTGRKAISLPYFDPFAAYYGKRQVETPSEINSLLVWFRKQKACYLIEEAASPGEERHYYFRRLLQAMEASAPGTVFQAYEGEQGLFKVYRIAQCS